MSLAHEQLVGWNFAQRLTTQIESAEAILLFYSENTENSTWVKHEIEFSLSKNKCIIPLLLSGSEERSWLHFYLGKFDWIKLDGENINGISDRILNVLSALHQRDDDTPVETNRNIEEDGLLDAPQSGKYKGSSFPGNKKKYGCGLIAIISTIVFLCFVLFYVSSLNSLCSPNPPYNLKTISSTKIVNELLDSLALEQWEIYAEGYECRSDNGASVWLLMFISFLVGGGLMFLLLWVKNSRKDNIKLSSDIASKISIDGDLQKEIESREVYTTHLEKGEYLIDFQDRQDENRHKTFNHMVTTKECKLVFANFLEESLQNGKNIKCFIAGSKRLQQERDALRAVTCVMYNKWESKNFRILSYTFEDFKKEHTPVPPQELYNKFIEEKADWA